MEIKMYQPKYDYKFIIQDLKDHNVDLKKFELKVKQMSQSDTMNQMMFEFIYDTLKINNYNINIFF